RTTKSNGRHRGRSSRRFTRTARIRAKPRRRDPGSMLGRITHTNTQPALAVTQRRQIAQIVARESAETLVGRSAGLRVEVVRRLVRPVADHVAGRFGTYDLALCESGMTDGSAWIVDDATRVLAIEGRRQLPAHGPLP